MRNKTLAIFVVLIVALAFAIAQVPGVFTQISIGSNVVIPTGTTGFTGTTNVVLSASPALTGTPTAPTAAPGTNTTQLATTAFVHAATGSGIDYYWTAPGCTTTTGQPIHCTTTTTLPGNMPDASYQIFCQANVVSFSGAPPDLHCSLNSTYPLPTASGSTITFDSVQTMQNGGGGGTSEMYFHAHHN